MRWPAHQEMSVSAFDDRRSSVFAPSNASINAPVSFSVSFDAGTIRSLAGKSDLLSFSTNCEEFLVSFSHCISEKQTHNIHLAILGISTLETTTIGPVSFSIIHQDALSRITNRRSGRALLADQLS